MSECIKNCRLCDKLILSQGISYNAGVNQLIIDLPAGSYGNYQKYCIVITQAIPTTTTINAQVVFTIGGDQTVGYPFLNCDCTPILASQVRTRRVYPSRVFTGVQSGVFKYIGNVPLPCKATSERSSIPVTTNNVNDVVTKAATK